MVAPQISGVSLGGQPVSLTEFRDRPTLITFWASWCGPCRQEAPEIARVSTGFGDRINILSINAGESPEDARRGVSALQISWPVVLDTTGQIQSAYEVEGIPMVFVLDRQGVVRYRGHSMPTDVHRLLDGLVH